MREFVKRTVKRGGVTRWERYRRVGVCRAKPSKPANIACNNGKSRRPRLKNDNAERLVAACKGKCVGVGIFGNQLWAPWLQRTDKRNAVRDASGVLRLTGHVTETGQYYAFWFGAASPASHGALWERLCSEFGPSRDIAGTYPEIPASNAIIGAYLRLELLLRHGRAKQCLDECKMLFLPMARATGTLWENLSPDSSLNHGFAASAAWLIRKAAALC